MAWSASTVAVWGLDDVLLEIEAEAGVIEIVGFEAETPFFAGEVGRDFFFGSSSGKGLKNREPEEVFSLDFEGDGFLALSIFGLAFVTEVGLFILVSSLVLLLLDSIFTAEYWALIYCVSLVASTDSWHANTALSCTIHR